MWYNHRRPLNLLIQEENNWVTINSFCFALMYIVYTVLVETKSWILLYCWMSSICYISRLLGFPFIIPFLWQSCSFDSIKVYVYRVESRGGSRNFSGGRRNFPSFTKNSIKRGVERVKIYFLPLPEWDFTPPLEWQLWGDRRGRRKFLKVLYNIKEKWVLT